MKPSIVCAVLVLLLPLAAAGGEINGKVLNAQGVPVAQATITVRSGRDAEILKVTTGADGTYATPDLPPGSYTVTVSVPGSQLTLQRKISLAEGSIQGNFQLPRSADEGVPASEEYNPNIFVFRIDQNELRNRLQTARGPDPHYVPDFTADQNYFGAEYGAPIMQFEPMRSRPLAASWRGTALWSLQNSVFNARNFFNVGPLLPSWSSSYGLTAGGPLLSRKATLLLQFGQGFSSGWVNGNVQEPRASERIPLSSNPQVNAIVAALLGAYPSQLPNLPGVSPRQFNGNARRDVRSKGAQARLDLKPAENTSCALSYSINDYYEDPFQIVLGQNPETDLRSQAAQAGAAKAFSPNTAGRFGFNFDRIALALQPTREFSQLLSSLGYRSVPDIQFTAVPTTYSELYNIGPGAQFPRRRVQNQYRYYSDLSRTFGEHTVKMGWSIMRAQVNDLQSDNARGTLSYTSNYGRTAAQNFLFGTPSSFTQALGNLYRGFRYWEHDFFLQDQIRVSPGLTLSLGARYELMTAPREVNHINDVGLPADKNNVAPRVGFAWNPAGGKTVIRGSYGISYGTIPAATYGFTRFNEPAIHVVMQTDPDLVAALNGVYQQTSRSARYLLSPSIVFPYSHQYGLSIEREFAGSTQLRIAYFGSRSFHLLTQKAYNRAAADPRLECNTPDPSRPCNNTMDINARRPDPRYFGTYEIESDSIAYFDALQVNVEKRLSHGLAVRAYYSFSKSIDTGGDFTNDAANGQNINELGLPTCEVCDHVRDLKAVSLFDTPQMAVISYSYALPAASQGSRMTSGVLRGWELRGATFLQSGTPFHVHTGSDSPGLGNVDGESGDRPNLLDPSILGRSVDNPDTSTNVLNSTMFNTIIPPGGRGNLGMSTFRKKGTNTTNLSLGRTFRLGADRLRTVLFRIESMNVFNRAQFDKPGTLLSSSATFGKITNTVNKGRQVQLSLHLSF